MIEAVYKEGKRDYSRMRVTRPKVEVEGKTSTRLRPIDTVIREDTLYDYLAILNRTERRAMIYYGHSRRGPRSE